MIKLLRVYNYLPAGTYLVLPDDVEASMIAQGFAQAMPTPVDSFPSLNQQVQPVTLGGNQSMQLNSGIFNPSVPQGPLILPNGPILAFASLGTNTTLVAGTLYRCEIYVPHVQLWTGIAVLNGATIGTNNGLVAIYDSAGNFIQSSALAGAVTAGANAFQNRAFIEPLLLGPGRYFLAYQANGATDTIRTWAAANGGNQMTASSTGTFGTLPASFVPPVTFTADVGPIARLYV